MKTKILIGLLMIVLPLKAQNFKGKATYKTHRKLNMPLGNEEKGMKTGMQDKLMEMVKKQFQKTYTLEFTKTESSYKQNQTLETPQSMTGVELKIVTIGTGDGTDIIYKNIKEKRFVNKTEVSGKQFLIKDKLFDFGWEMTSETKNIGKYTCYKAIRNREEVQTNFEISKDGKGQEKKEKVNITTVAWYTPQIPISNGPRDFWGLPGLILEIQDGKLTIVCSEIILNSSENTLIEEPKKGKKVTQAKFDKIMDTHSKDMIERFKNKRKSKDGNSMSFEIRG